MTTPAPSCQQMFEEHQRWLRHVVQQRIPEHDAIADILQETALALVKAFPHVPDPVAPWLYRVTIRQILLYRRKQGRQRRLAAGYAETMGDSDELFAPDPRVWLLNQELQAGVRQAMARLPELDRQILVLKHNENWTYQQLADHLGVRRSTIEYRLLRARKRLRQALLALQMETAR